MKKNDMTTGLKLIRKLNKKNEMKYRTELASFYDFLETMDCGKHVVVTVAIPPNMTKNDVVRGISNEIHNVTIGNDVNISEKLFLLTCLINNLMKMEMPTKGLVGIFGTYNNNDGKKTAWCFRCEYPEYFEPPFTVCQYSLRFGNVPNMEILKGGLLGQYGSSSVFIKKDKKQEKEKTNSDSDSSYSDNTINKTLNVFVECEESSDSN
jgi:hypothetical protein